MVSKVIKTVGVTACAAIAPFSAASACGKASYGELTKIDIATSATHEADVRTKGLNPLPRKTEAIDPASPLGSDKIIRVPAKDFKTEATQRCLNAPVNISFESDRQIVISAYQSGTVRTVLFDFNGDAPNGPCPRFPAGKPDFSGTATGPYIVSNDKGPDNVINRADAIAAQQAGCIALDFKVR